MQQEAQNGLSLNSKISDNALEIRAISDLLEHLVTIDFVPQNVFKWWTFNQSRQGRQ